MSEIKVSGYLEQIRQLQTPEQRKLSQARRVDRYSKNDRIAALVEDGNLLQTVIPSHKEKYQIIADTIAADIEIGNNEMAGIYQRLSKSVAAYIRSEGESIREARATTIQQLKAKSDPFADSEQSMMRYMTELTLTGGLAGKNQWQILQKAEATATSPDPGATAFWARNFEEIFSNASKGGAPAGQQFDTFGESKRISAALDAATTRKMSAAQLTAHQQLTDFESAWKESNIEQTLQLVEASITEQGDLRVAELVKPRERTSQENRVADARQNIRQVKAEREAAAEEKAAFDALG